MADIADSGNETAELFLQTELAKSKRQEGPTPDGSCHYCGEDLADAGLPPEQQTLRWCNVQCTRDYEDEQRHLQRAGRA